MKVFRIIEAIGMVVITFITASSTVICMDFAIRGCWSESWQMFFRAINMKDVTPVQFIQGVNTMCVVMGVILTVFFAIMTFKTFRKIWG